MKSWFEVVDGLAGLVLDRDVDNHQVGVGGELDVGLGHLSGRRSPWRLLLSGSRESDEGDNGVRGAYQKLNRRSSVTVRVPEAAVGSP